MGDSFVRRIGAAADRGCPFCRSIFHTEPRVGETVFFLSGSSTGTLGTVVPPPRSLREGEFCVSRPHNPNALRTCHGERDRLVPAGAYMVPDWMPNLSMEDSFYFHASLGECITLPEEGADRDNISEALIGAISCCWSRRLPVDSTDVWRLLAAHGVSGTYQDPICYAFDFGFSLTVKLQGRRPVQRRRMPPMSRIQYMTKHKEALWTRIKGHDNLPELFGRKGAKMGTIDAKNPYHSFLA